jgi:hypothetical protein
MHEIDAEIGAYVLEICLYPDSSYWTTYLRKMVQIWAKLAPKLCLSDPTQQRVDLFCMRPASIILEFTMPRTNGMRKIYNVT